MLQPLRPRRPLLHLLPLRRRLSAGSSDARPPAPLPDAAAAEEEEVAARREAYKQVQNLDFMTAAKILFTVPPKRKKFGLDFHLVQLFFACMPSLAVYLVAQYARHEIKRMEAEVDEIKKKEEELEKAKQLELESVEEDTDTKLSKVLARLDTLEDVVKEIVDDKRKTSSNLSANEENSSPDKASASKSNANVSELATIKSKDKSGVTNPPSNTTQETPKRNGDRVPSGPKT